MRPRLLFSISSPDSQSDGRPPPCSYFAPAPPLQHHYRPRPLRLSLLLCPATLSGSAPQQLLHVVDSAARH
ncbi:unnamed protein product [Linum trigynum]|uniref:Uncharacterized protein n=1 Tax=Linum trigynum TaxID=586398 RepID=A0AAV2CXE5_9ROSI